MSRLIILFIALILLFGSYLFFWTGDREEEVVKMTPTPDYENWHLYHDKEGRFSALFPTLPIHAAENYKDPKTEELRTYEMFVSERDDGSVFMVNLITFPEGADLDAEQLYSRFINDMLTANPKNELENSTATTFHDSKSYDFSLRNDEMRIQSKIFLNDRSLYLFSRVVPIGSVKDEQFTFFVNSFTFATPKK